MTTLQEAAMRKALEYIEGATAGLLAKIDAIDSLRTALAQQGQEPIAWAVQGCSRMWRGEFAEADAKAEAARCGGTCYAYPLYIAAPAPQAQPWQTIEQRNASVIARFHAQPVAQPRELTDEQVQRAMTAISNASFGDIQPTAEEMRVALEAAEKARE